MDVNIIMQLIGSVGFPIVACGAMFWLVNKLQDQHREDLDAIRSALNANTAALSELQAAIRTIGGPTA